MGAQRGHHVESSPLTLLEVEVLLCRRVIFINGMAKNRKPNERDVICVDSVAETT